MEGPHSHSSGCSMVPLRNIFGRTTKGLCTGSLRVRGGEQGDAMMPLLFAVGQHGALEAIHRRMNPGEFLMAFHDDVYMATPPARVGPMYHSGARRTLCARCHPGSPRQDQGVEPSRGPSCRLQRTGSDCPRHPPRSRGVDRFHDPNCSARHQSVGNADRSSRFRRRSVGGNEKGTRSVAQQNFFLQ